MKNQVTEKEYKQVLIDTLDHFDSFCRKNHLKYFLIGGTLLGAIRHNGFIPWDDDIDVGMPREDYEKFSKLFEDNDDFKFLDCHKNKKYYLPYGKLCNYKIDLHENINSKLHIGAYIDIFPFDFIKDKHDKKLVKFLSNKSIFKKIKNLKYAELNKERNFLKNFVIFFLHILYPFSLNHIAKVKDRKIKKFVGNQNSLYFGNIFGAWGIKEISYAFNFQKLELHKFEGKQYFIPSEYDKILTEVYGDYMTLPPIDKRITHHSYCAYWR